jgi:hypothetical protein
MNIILHIVHAAEIDVLAAYHEIIHQKGNTRRQLRPF